MYFAEIIYLMKIGDNEMRKRIVAIIMAAAMIFSSVSIPNYANAEKDKMYWPKGPKVTSSSAIIMEANTGAVLYEKKVHDKHYPASITKILTTLLAVENCDLSETVTFSADAVFKTEGTRIARDLNEEMSLEDTLYAVMLGSANECAYATAEHVGGDYDTFISMMGDKLKELGCEDTHFTNPHGLPDKDHYTSAYDMALISRAAIMNDKFRTITGTKKYVIPPTNKHKDETPLINHNGMLTYYKTGKYIYENCIGGKTGYTNAAKHTLVTYAERNGMLLICVVMETSFDGQYQDTTKLLDYCFDNFQMHKISECDDDYNTDSIKESSSFVSAKPYLYVDEDAMVVLPKTASFANVISKVNTDNVTDEIAGTIEYSYGNRSIGSANILINKEEIEKYKFGDEKPNTKEKKKVVKINFMMIFKIIVAVILLAVLLFATIYVRRNIYLIRYAIRSKRQQKVKEITFKGKRSRRRRRRKKKRDRNSSI